MTSRSPLSTHPDHGVSSVAAGAACLAAPITTSTPASTAELTSAFIHTTCSTTWRSFARRLLLAAL